jgi:asparagine synthase (glutamine-hydrolysing)
MCGIFGKFFFEKTDIKTKTYKPCLDTLTHRGPDDEGFYKDENILLGEKRLSIIDLSSAGHMPMSNEDGSLWIVFNGEIYNFLQLRKKLEKKHKFKSKTDTEVILHLYEEKGPAALQDLRGMFAFAIWDKKKKELFIARDRLGKKPIKFYYNNKFFIFASELKAILKDKTVPKEMDYTAIDEYLTYQYIPSPKTGFKNIYKLEPAHYLIIKSSGELIKTRYWQLDFSKKLDLKEEEWEERILKKLKESIKIRLVGDVPIGAHLSGGIDSSMIVALMSEELNKPVKTFSVGFEESNYDERSYARLVTHKYKTDHHELIVKPSMINILPKLVYHYEELYADPSMLPTWYLCEMTKNEVTVALNGDGGDENFAGYDRYNIFKLYLQLKKLPLKKLIGNANNILYKHTMLPLFKKGAKFFKISGEDEYKFYLQLIGYFTQEEKQKLYTKDFLHKVNTLKSEEYLLSKFQDSKHLGWLDRLLYTDITSYLPDDLLVKVDIAGMAHSLEVRSPFLDHEFIELTAQMPNSLKIRGYYKKYLLKKIAKKYLPEKNIQRSKQGFGAPLKYWFRDQLQNYLKEKLLDSKFLSYGICTESGIKELIDLHTKSTRDYSNKLWTLLVLREWLHLWF